MPCQLLSYNAYVRDFVPTRVEGRISRPGCGIARPRVGKSRPPEAENQPFGHEFWPPGRAPPPEAGNPARGLSRLSGWSMYIGKPKAWLRNRMGLVLGVFYTFDSAKNSQVSTLGDRLIPESILEIPRLPL